MYHSRGDCCSCLVRHVVKTQERCNLSPRMIYVYPGCISGTSRLLQHTASIKGVITFTHTRLMSSRCFMIYSRIHKRYIQERLPYTRSLRQPQVFLENRANTKSREYISTYVTCATTDCMVITTW